MNKICVTLLTAAFVLASCNQTSSASSSSSEPKYFTISWKNDDGTVLYEDNNALEGSIPSYQGQTPTKPSSSGMEYVFSGWTPDIKVVVSDQIYTATFEAVKKVYKITFDLDGGKSPSYVESKLATRLDPSLFFYDVTKYDLIFNGWKCDGKLILDEKGNILDTTFELNSDVTFVASYKLPRWNLEVVSSNEEKGTVAITSDISEDGYEFGSSVTVAATPLNDCVFDGWYADDEKVSEEATYTFEMPNYDYVLTGVFLNEEDQERNRQIELGQYPGIKKDKVTFGTFPQSRVSDEDLIAQLEEKYKEDESSPYVEIEDVMYARMIAKPYETGYEFNDGSVIVADQAYWFKFDLISWRIISSNQGVYTALSDMILTSYLFHDTLDVTTEGYYPNSYSMSLLSITVNMLFFMVSLNEGAADYVVKQHIDNSAAASGSSSNPYGVEDSDELSYLLSHADYVNTDYGFEETTEASEFRECKATDYARASGAIYTTQREYSGNSPYWTRSPAFDKETDAQIIDVDGSFSQKQVDTNNIGVRPAISFALTPQERS